MNKAAIQAQIVSHFWSESLKQFLAETDRVFNDHELMGLVWRAVPEYQERLRLLRLISDHLPAVSDHARLCANFMEASFARFQQHAPGEVYELRITEPNEVEERYLCDSYETALEMIDKFWACYDFSHETYATRYNVVKRSILRTNDTFREDELGCCVLGPGKVLLEADGGELHCEYWPCDGNCLECTKAIDCMDLLFPPFLPNLSLVKYRGQNGSTKFGITFEPVRDKQFDNVYILPLGGCTDPDWWDHEHIVHWNVDTASEEELSDIQKEQAASLRCFLENHIKEHHRQEQAPALQENSPANTKEEL